MSANGKSAQRLTDEERRQYEEDGYFIRPKMFGADEMDALRARIDEIVELIEASDALTDQQKRTILRRPDQTKETAGTLPLDNMYRIHTFSAFVRSHIRDERRLAPVRDIVGSDLFCPNDLYFLKPPGTGRPVAWHQDSWYFRNTYISSVGEDIDRSTIGTWMALDDADEQNGCLWVVPGSHHLGVVDHGQVESEGYFLQKRLTMTDETAEQAIPVEVPKGSLIFFNNALFHGSHQNRSNRYRRAYVVHYMKSTIQHIEGKRWIIPGTEEWGTPEMYVCGRLYPDCVQTTPADASMNWDAALGRTLTKNEVRVKSN